MAGKIALNQRQHYRLKTATLKYVLLTATMVTGVRLRHVVVVVMVEIKYVIGNATTPPQSGTGEIVRILALQTRLGCVTYINVLYMEVLQHGHCFQTVQGHVEVVLEHGQGTAQTPSQPMVVIIVPV